MSNLPYRALAIEGGGMRGYYAATLLDELCRRFNDDSSKVDLGKNLNLICGTSTGAILACAIAKGIALPEVMKMYKDEGEQIFPNPYPTKSRIKKAVWFCRHFFRHSAKEKFLENVLKKHFDDMTLEGIYKKRGIALCIPTVNASNYLAWVFKTPHKENLKRDKPYRLVDVCMASSAAPLLFPPHVIANPNNQRNIQHFIDGGIWANSPVLVALIEALQIAQLDQDIHILSVGTSSAPVGVPNVLRESQWGIRKLNFGVESMTMFISAQSYGHYSMAIFIANRLSENGRKIKIMQLVENPKSPDSYSAIGIDKAGKEAICTMNRMAKSDALENYSRVFTKGEDLEIRDFFIPQTTSEEPDNEKTKKHQ